MSSRFLGIVTLLVLTVFGHGTLSADDPKPRTWTDATGSFTVEAVFVDLSDGKVRLKKTDGQVITVELEKLSSADQQVARSLSKETKEGGDKPVKVSQLTGKAVELKHDDGKAAGKKSFPRGIASSFESPGDDYYLTSVRIHGSRYGATRAPKEDFSVALCDKDFKLIADFEFPYSKVERGNPGWIELRVKPTKVPREFVICLNFNPTSTKGVFVSHDAEGSSLVGLPGKKAGGFSGGDWMLRANVDRLKDGE